MKKLAAGLLLFLLLFVTLGDKEAQAAPDLNKFTGKWSCSITDAALLDLTGLRQQLENLTGSKIPNEQWEIMQGPLIASQTSALNELKKKSFTMDIYDSYNKGIAADVINANGTKSTSKSTTVSGDSLIFQFNQFLMPGASSTNICTTTVVGGALNGRVAIETKISQNGMTLTLKSSLGFVGTMTESYAAPASKEPTEIEIIDASGKDIDVYYGKPGSKASFNYRIYPSDYDLKYIKRLEWYSNDESVATVDQRGLVTFHKNGKTQVVVWINGDYALSDSISIIVDESLATDSQGQTPAQTTPKTSTADNTSPATPVAPATGQNTIPDSGKSTSPAQDSKETDKKNDSGKILDTVQDTASGFADIVSKVSSFIPEPETMSKVPLLDLLVFTYEVDKDQRENKGFGDADKHSEQKAFWGNVVAAGPIGAVPKALDAVLEVSKKFGLDFDFSFEKTFKGTTNFLFDMFGSNSRASIEEIKKRHLKNHYGVIGGFGAWTASAINDISNWGSKTREEIDKLK